MCIFLKDLQFFNDEQWVRCYSERDDKSELLYEAHDFQGHYWPSLAQDVKKYGQSCNSCQKHQRKDQTHNQRHQTWMEFNECVAMDFLGPLESINNKCYILIIVDLCTRFPMLEACKDTSSASVIKLLQKWTTEFGFPTHLISDNASGMTSRTINDWLSMRGIRRKVIPTYSPQCNGGCERMVQEVLRRLRRTCTNEKNWSGHVKEVENAIRSASYNITGLSSFQMLMGYQPRHELHQPILDNDLENDDSVSNEANCLRMSTVLSRRWNAIDQQIEKQRHRTAKQNLKSDDFHISEIVWMYESSLDKQWSRKLASRWSGPFRLENKIGNNTYEAIHWESHKRPIVHRDLLKQAVIREPPNID